MKKLLTLIPIIAFGVVASCKQSTESKINEAKEAAEKAKDDPEAAAEKMADIQNEMSDVLEDVEDKESAEEAIEKLDPIVQQLGAFMNGMAKNAGEGDPKRDPEMEKKAQEIMAKSTERLEKAKVKAMTVFAQHPELLAKYQETMAKMLKTQ